MVLALIICCLPLFATSKRIVAEAKLTSKHQPTVEPGQELNGFDDPDPSDHHRPMSDKPGWELDLDDAENVVDVDHSDEPDWELDLDNLPDKNVTTPEKPVEPVLETDYHPCGYLPDGKRTPRWYMGDEVSAMGQKQKLTGIDAVMHPMAKKIHVNQKGGFLPSFLKDCWKGCLMEKDYFVFVDRMFDFGGEGKCSASHDCQYQRFEVTGQDSNVEIVAQKPKRNARVSMDCENILARTGSVNLVRKKCAGHNAKKNCDVVHFENVGYHKTFAACFERWIKVAKKMKWIDPKHAAYGAPVIYEKGPNGGPKAVVKV